jgi:mannosyl-3-phosphoglycerate phosphatase
VRDVSLVIFTDLDGTLLDHHTYSFEAAAHGLEAACRARVPVVLCSSKTRAEIEAIQYELLMRYPCADEYGDPMFHPFISENGSGIFISRGYFSTRPSSARPVGPYDLVAFGRPYEDVVATLRRVAADVRVPVSGFSDMSVAQIAVECGCSEEQARLAKCREFDEPFRILEGTTAARMRLLQALGGRGLQCTRGARFQHAMGLTDKGRAAKHLKHLYEDEPGRRVVTVGLGDSSNDAALLGAVDIPVIVRNQAADVARLRRQVPGAFVTDQRGPAGWAHAVSQLVATFAAPCCEVAQ